MTLSKAISAFVFGTCLFACQDTRAIRREFKVIHSEQSTPYERDLQYLVEAETGGKRAAALSDGAMLVHEPNRPLVARIVGVDNDGDGNLDWTHSYCGNIYSPRKGRSCAEVYESAYDLLR